MADREQEMTKILLAVSGGIDSMYMACRAPELFPGAAFAVAHCNFCLRGEESDGDEAFVREWCRKSGIECFTRRFDTKGHSRQQGISIEMAARELRYEWFRELCLEHGYDAVAVAHNADDNAETLVLNLLRGTGTRGIRGMGSREGVLRPLLGTSRSDIRKWMTEHGCSWREDRTNADSAYKRNLIRNEIFPLFARINPSFMKTLNADMRIFAQADDIVGEYCRHAAERIILPDGSISVPELTATPHWESVLWRILEDSGISAEEFASLVRSLSTGKQYAGRRYGPVTGASGKLVVGNGRNTESASGPEVEIIGRDELKDLRQAEGILVADADRIPMPLKIRRWQAGDWMVPLGMRGKKKISDIFTDLHIPVTEKDGALVIELDGSHVAALLYRKIDDSVKVTGCTTRVIRMRQKKEKDGKDQ